MTLLAPRRRAQQQRALATLDDILSEFGGIRLPPLRWTIEPTSALTGHVPPLATQEEIRELFDAWADLIGTQRMDESEQFDRTLLRAVAPRYGLFHVHVSVQATIPTVLMREDASLMAISHELRERVDA